MNKNLARIGERNGFFGKEHSPETRAVMAEKARENRAKLGYPGRLRKYGISDEVYFAKRAAGFKWCSTCKGFLSLDKFSEKAGAICKLHAGERAKTYNIEWRERNPHKSKEYYANGKHSDRRRKIGKKYGVTHEWYEQKFAEQSGGCAVCGGNSGKKLYLDIDHCHVSGKVRGLLCGKCNTAMERLDACLGWAEKASAYLAKYLNQ